MSIRFLEGRRRTGEPFHFFFSFFFKLEKKTAETEVDIIKTAESLVWPYKQVAPFTVSSLGRISAISRSITNELVAVLWKFVKGGQDNSESSRPCVKCALFQPPGGDRLVPGETRRWQSPSPAGCCQSCAWIWGLSLAMEMGAGSSKEHGVPRDQESVLQVTPEIVQRGKAKEQASPGQHVWCSRRAPTGGICLFFLHLCPDRWERQGYSPMHWASSLLHQC